MFLLQLIFIYQKYGKLLWKDFCNTLLVKKIPMKSDQLFCGNQYFSLTNNFSRLNLIPTKNFYHSIFSAEWKPNNQNLKKKLLGLLYHNLAEWRWVGKGN